LAYEMFKDEIVNSVQGFFTMDFVGEDRVYFPDYQTDVLDRHKSEFQACLLWLVEMHVFNSAQVEEISEIREHRNKIAHELLDFLFNPAAQIDLALFDRLRFYLRIVDRFFGQIQVDANSDFDGKDVDPGEIKSITSVFLDIVCQSVASETG